MKSIKSMNRLFAKLGSRLKHASYRLRGRKQNFKELYKEGGFSGRELPLSGSGSTLEQTEMIREKLPGIFHELKIKSLLDAPCGDFTWMHELDLGEISYIGADIVDDVVNENISTHSRRNRSFIVADIVKDPLPQADIILCRDCFVHLSNKDIVRAIRNFKKTQSTYLLTTTFSSINQNRDMVSGRGWRPINLNMPPFNLPPPLRLIAEGCTEHNGEFADKSLGLWKLTDMMI